MGNIFSSSPVKTESDTTTPSTKATSTSNKRRASLSTSEESPSSKKTNMPSAKNSVKKPAGKQLTAAELGEKYVGTGKPGGAKDPNPARWEDHKQHPFSSGLCIATLLDGSKCQKTWAEAYVPYCKPCMEKGDPSAKVITHERFGKCLVAQRDLPKGYKMALFGKVYEEENMPEADKEWGFECSDGTFINPVKYSGSLPQFCQCPGPNEKVTVTFAQPHLLMEAVERHEDREYPYASMLFQTTMPVPKNHQLVMMYAENEKATEVFFSERGISRCDVWQKNAPTILKKCAPADPKNLKLTGKPISKAEKDKKVKAWELHEKQKMKSAAEKENMTKQKLKMSSNATAMSKMKEVKKKNGKDKSGKSTGSMKSTATSSKAAMKKK